MRIFIQYDEKGEIRGAMTTTLEDFAVKPSSGMRVHIVERDFPNEEELRRFLGELHSFRVASTPSGRSTLVHKPADEEGRGANVKRS